MAIRNEPKTYDLVQKLPTGPTFALSAFEDFLPPHALF